MLTQCTIIQDNKGGIRNSDSISDFLSLIIKTTEDHWEFRSCLIECVARTSDDIKFELTKCGQYMDILKDWLKEMRTKSSHESLVYKILNSMLKLPINHLKAESLKKLGQILQRGFSSKRKEKYREIELSSRVENMTEKLIKRLVETLRKINDRPANSPLPQISRPSVSSNTATTTEMKERKKRPRPIQQVKDSDSTENSRVKRVKTNEKEEEEDEVKEVEKMEIIEEPSQEEVFLPVITSSTGPSFQSPSSMIKKKSKVSKNKKSVRFNLNLNTTHFVPYKEKSTLRKDEPSKHKLSRAEAQLLAKKKGVEGEILIFGVSTEIEWITPSLVDGFIYTDVTDKSEIERMNERRVRMGEGRKYKVTSREKPPANPAPQDTNDRMKRMRFGKTIEIVLKQSVSNVTNTTSTMSSVGNASKMYLGMGFQSKSSDVCKYFNTLGGCQRGTLCKFLHVKK